MKKVLLNKKAIIIISVSVVMVLASVFTGIGVALNQNKQDPIENIENNEQIDLDPTNTRTEMTLSKADINQTHRLIPNTASIINTNTETTELDITVVTVKITNIEPEASLIWMFTEASSLNDGDKKSYKDLFEVVLYKKDASGAYTQVWTEGDKLPAVEESTYKVAVRMVEPSSVKDESNNPIYNDAEIMNMQFKLKIAFDIIEKETPQN